MWWTRALVAVGLAVVLGVPFLVRRAEVAGDRAGLEGARTLIVVTPHVEQIRSEFSWAFDRWHRRVHGEPAAIDWRAVGGTSEILLQLQAQYAAAASAGLISVGEDGRASAAPGTIGFDLMMGGGTYEHGRLKRGVTVRVGERDLKFPMSAPAGFSQEQLDAWYGENRIGAQPLYDPEQYWLGTALSGFGIVYNRDVLRELGLPEPEQFRDLTDGRYAGMLALADPRQSGSVMTTYESILNKEGWEEGWRILRELCANARYFATSSVRPPVDVSQGDAAAGLAIDFYGRGQAQAVLREGQTAEECRVGYVDPKGAVYIDADPASILLGGPDSELARRFIEFCLTEEGQALWQMRATEREGKDNPRLETGEGGEVMGPRRYELRRMPVRPVMYEKYAGYFVDKASPFEAAAELPQRGWRDSIGVMMGAFGIDTSEELREAWGVLREARADPAFPGDVLAEMEGAFYAMPQHRTRPGALTPGEIRSLSKAAIAIVAQVPVATIDGIAAGLPRLRSEGKVEPEVLDELASLVKARPSEERTVVLALRFEPVHFDAISLDTKRWRDAERAGRARIGYTEFFRGQYRRVVELGRRRG